MLAGFCQDLAENDGLYVGKLEWSEHILPLKTLKLSHLGAKSSQAICTFNQTKCFGFNCDTLVLFIFSACVTVKSVYLEKKLQKDIFIFKCKTKVMYVITQMSQMNLIAPFTVSFDSFEFSQISQNWQ